MSGGSAERVIQVQAEKCKTDGKKPIEIQSYTDQPSSILAVRSKRADAFFSSQAPLTYFVAKPTASLNSRASARRTALKISSGCRVQKGSELGPLLNDTIKVLMDNGTYAAIMKKWGLENNMIKQPASTLGASCRNE